MAEKRILTIERAKWRRGGDSDALAKEFGLTYMLNDEGLMCCLGFDAIACGVPDEAILNVGEPPEIEGLEGLERYRTSDRLVRDENAPWRFKQTDAVGDAITANDSGNLDDSTRERQVRDALLKLGWDDVVFV